MAPLVVYASVGLEFVGAAFFAFAVFTGTESIALLVLGFLLQAVATPVAGSFAGCFLGQLRDSARAPFFFSAAIYVFGVIIAITLLTPIAAPLGPLFSAGCFVASCSLMLRARRRQAGAAPTSRRRLISTTSDVDADDDALVHGLALSSLSPEFEVLSGEKLEQDAGSQPELVVGEALLQPV